MPGSRLFQSLRRPIVRSGCFGEALASPRHELKEGGGGGYMANIRKRKRGAWLSPILPPVGIAAMPPRPLVG